MDKIKVYIVDDSLIFRAMLETMVMQDARFDICGIAQSVNEALTDIGWMLPDIILLDMNFREGPSGLHFLEEIDGHWHDMSVIVVSADARHGSDVCRAAFDRGAVACFDKARVIRSGRELIALMGELGQRNSLSGQRFSRAITLPVAHH
jgi:chemotaxis response regulator CheB